MDDYKRILDYLVEEDASAKNMSEICLIARVRGFVKGLQDDYLKGLEIQFKDEGAGV